MRINKKVLSILLSVSAMAFMLVGCNGNASKDGTTIVCTIFPIYDWVCEMTEGIDDVNVVLLADNGADMHSYQPTAKDILTVSDCDIFIYVGGESDEWIDEYLANNEKQERTEINLMEVLENNVLEESDDGIVSGEEEEEETEYDEHVWMSLKRSKICVEHIGEIIKAKIGNAEAVSNNTDTYMAELVSLENEYSAFFESLDNPVITVADRFPFRYLVEDYNIDYYAAFSGCSTETDASFDTIITLGENFASTGEEIIFITESGNEELAETVLEQAGVEASIEKINSVQSVVLDENGGYDKGYLELMKDNLEVFKTYMK